MRRAPLASVRVAISLLVALLVAGTGTGPARGEFASPAPVAGMPLPVEVERDGILVRAEAGLERDAARTAARAPLVLAGIRADLEGLPGPPRIEIRLVKQAENLALASPPGRVPPGWAAGVAYPDVGVVVVAERRGPDFLGLENVVDHELAHLVLDAALGGRAPRWLSEGFAYLHAPEMSLARARTLTGMAWSGDVIPLWRLDRSFPLEKHAASRAYAQAYDFTAFLAKRGRTSQPYDDGDRWAFRDFLAGIAGGKTVSEAARDVYGATLAELEIEWYEDLRSRFLTVPVGLFGAGVWVLAAVLLVIAFLRRRLQNRKRLARWAEEETAQEAAVEYLH